MPPTSLIGWRELHRHCRPLKETGQGTAGQGGDDVRVADGEGEVGVRARREVV
jgi:hypothetical protein